MLVSIRAYYAEALADFATEDCLSLFRLLDRLGQASGASPAPRGNDRRRRRGKIPPLRRIDIAAERSHVALHKDEMSPVSAERRAGASHSDRALVRPCRVEKSFMAA